MLVMLAIIFTISGCGDKAEDARKELGKLNVQYTAESFIKAIENKDNIVTKLFIEAGMSQDSKDVNGYSALMAAANAGNQEVFGQLLEKNADIRSKTKQGMDVLLYASEKGNVSAIKIAVEKGIDINEQDESGQTALYHAVKANQIDSVKSLLQQSAIDVNKADKKGVTPLMVAAKGGNLELTLILLSASANVGIKDSQEWNALKYAQNSKNEDIMREIRNAGGKEESWRKVSTGTYIDSNLGYRYRLQITQVRDAYITTDLYCVSDNGNTVASVAIKGEFDDDGTLNFNYVDGWRNKGKGTITVVNESTIKIDTDLTERNRDARMFIMPGEHLLKKMP